MPAMLPVVYALLTFAWLRAALAPMVTAVGRAG
jgi:hypothetical protein